MGPRVDSMLPHVGVCCSHAGLRKIPLVLPGHAFKLHIGNTLTSILTSYILKITTAEVLFLIEEPSSNILTFYFPHLKNSISLRNGGDYYYRSWGHRPGSSPKPALSFEQSGDLCPERL